MKIIGRLMITVLLAGLCGCLPLCLAGGGAGGYKTATDERTVGEMVEDKEITARVNSALGKDKKVNAAGVDVDTVNGVVYLSGVVRTKEAAARAEKIARKVPKVKNVKNNLQVGEKSLGEAIDDKILGSRIKAKLIGEPGVKSLNIDVDVDLGVASLTGIVENRSQRDKVLSLARGEKGVVRVIDNLQVRK